MVSIAAAATVLLSDGSAAFEYLVVEEEFGGSSLADWSANGGTWRLENGALKGTAGPYESSIYWKHAAVRRPFTVEFEVTFTSTPPGEVGKHGGVIFTEEPYGRYERGYELDWIDRVADRGYRFVRLDGAPTDPVGFPRETTIEAGRAYSWKLVADDATIRLEVDGATVASVEDATYDGPFHVGVWLYAGSAATFDRFAVRAERASAPAPGPLHLAQVLHIAAADDGSAIPVGPVPRPTRYRDLSGSPVRFLHEGHRGGAYHVGSGNETDPFAIQLDGVDAFLRPDALQPPLEAYAVAIWFRARAAGPLVTYASGTTLAPGARVAASLAIDADGRLVFAPGGGGSVASVATVDDDAWHHAVASFGPAGASLALDGGAPVVDAAPASPAPFLGRWILGAAPGPSYLAAHLASFRVFARPLATDEAAALARLGPGSLATPGTPIPGPVLRWSAADAEGVGPTPVADAGGVERVRDLSGHGRDGRFLYRAGTWWSGLAPVSGRFDPPAFRFDGEDDILVSARREPAPDAFTLSVWFRTFEPGGKIAGFEGDDDLFSGEYDRHLYVGERGGLVFGAWDGRPVTVNTSRVVADGAWHHVAASIGERGSENGTRLWLDGVLVAERPENRKASYLGFWRLGGGSLVRWDETSTEWFNGSIADFQVFDRVLDAPAVAALRAAGPGPLPASSRADVPTDGLALHVLAADPLGTGAAPGDVPGVETFVLRDLSPAGNDVRLENSLGNAGLDGEPRRNRWFAGSGAPHDPYAIAFDGFDDSAPATRRTASPPTFTASVWFRPHAAAGMLLGFQEDRPDESFVVDRALYIGDDGRLRFAAGREDPALVRSRSIVVDGWHHAAVTYDAKTMILYVDGEAQDTNASVPLPRVPGWWSLASDAFGLFPEGPLWLRFGGLVAEARVYERALSPEEVRALSSGPGGKAAAVVADLVAVSVAPVGSLQVGTDARFEARVRNDGARAVAGTARFAVDGTPIGSVALDELVPGADVAVASPAWRASAGSHTVRVEVVARNATEIDVADNAAERPFRVASALAGPDLVLTAFEALAARPREGQPIELRAVVRNGGDVATANFTVRFLVDGAGVADLVVPPLPPGAVADVRAPPWSPTAGPRRLSVEVDPFDTVNETDEGVADLGFHLPVAEAQPRLRVTDLYALPGALREGDEAVVYARVRNEGEGAARSPTIRLLLDGRDLATAAPASIGPGETLEVSGSWRAVAGEHVARVDLGDAPASRAPARVTLPSLGGGAPVRLGDGDRGATVGETIVTVTRLPETRPARIVRDAGRTVETPRLPVPELATASRRPDLVPVGLWATAPPTVGFETTFVAAIANNGTAAAGAFRYRFFVDGVVVGEGVVRGLSPKEAVTVSSGRWLATPGDHLVAVVADPDHETPDELRTNNDWDSVVSAASTAAGGAPDAGLLRLGLVPETPRADEPFVVAATIANNGTGIASGEVRFLLDGVLVGSASFRELPPRATATVLSPRLVAEAGARALRVVIVAAGEAAPGDDAREIVLDVRGARA